MDGLSLAQRLGDALLLLRPARAIQRVSEAIPEPKQHLRSGVGAAEGMGLGLSISYGIVQSFGGQISGRNHDEGGSVFTVVLARAGLSEAA